MFPVLRHLHRSHGARVFVKIKIIEERLRNIFRKLPCCFYHLKNTYFCENISKKMQKALLYLLAGTAISFLLNYFLLGSQGWELDLYYGVAFGSAWGMAYFLDNVKFSLPQKLGISFAGMALLVVVGLFLFNVEKAVPSVLKFSMVFVAYYLIASFKPSKSLRK